MGIEPIEPPLRISCLDHRGMPSAMDVRNFAVRGATCGNLRQLPPKTGIDPFMTSVF
jgi:hypothetical protein